VHVLQPHSPERTAVAGPTSAFIASYLVDKNK